MKFYVRRFIASLLALPIVLGAYFLFVALLAGFSVGGGFDYTVFYSIAFVWVGAVTFAPEFWRFVQRVSGE
jgi:hypothetical protein